MKNILMGLLYVLIMLIILTLAYSLPDILMPKTVINYTGLTEKKHVPYLRCVDMDSYIETIKKIERDDIERYRKQKEKNERQNSKDYSK